MNTGASTFARTIAGPYRLAASRDAIEFQTLISVIQAARNQHDGSTRNRSRRSTSNHSARVSPSNGWTMVWAISRRSRNSTVDVTPNTWNRENDRRDRKTRPGVAGRVEL